MSGSGRDGPVVRLYNKSMQERLQKILSAHGICSRRKAEEFIDQGLVTVNGEVAHVGQKADAASDEIMVNGKNIRDGRDPCRDALEERLYYIMNKPTGIITSNVDNPDHPDRTVRDLLPKELQGKIYPVGRLDKETSGLLLFTNDGVLAYRLTHPSFNHEKEYEVVTTDLIKDGQLRKLQEGITIDGEKTKSATINRINETTFTIALTQGKNRQIRRMCQKVGAPLRYLRRIRIMTLAPTLKEGAFRELTEAERSELLASTELE